MKDEVKDYRITKSKNINVNEKLSHYNDTIKRLIQLLKSTKEYKTFAEVLEVSKSTYMRKKKQTKEPKCKHDAKIENWKIIKQLSKYYPDIEKDYNKIDPKYINVYIYRTEGDNWIPEEAYNFSIKFKETALKDVPMNLIEEYLKELHLIWREREKNIVDFIRRRYEQEKKDIIRRVLYYNISIIIAFLVQL